MSCPWPLSLPYSPSIARPVVPYPAHLFIDVLAKVGYVKNATSIARRSQGRPGLCASEQPDSTICLVFVSIQHPTANDVANNGTSPVHLNLCNFDHSEGQVFI